MAKEIEKVKKTTKKTTNVKDEKEKKTRVKKATKTTSSKKTSTKKTNVKSTTKKTTPSKATTKKATTSQKTTRKKVAEKKSPVLEYYDLPYRYNETVIKLLAQTPSVLFVYWDISDEERNQLLKQYGENFFQDTKPVLVIHNITKDYVFEIEINDFANCWYLNVGDTKCEYYIELGRRPRNTNITIPNNYLYITASNVIESPNNHVLLEKQSNVVYFRNVKTGETQAKNIATMSFIRNMGKIYHIYDLYREFYKDEITTNNPTSGLF